jgi:hypothetical protein
MVSAHEQASSIPCQKSILGSPRVTFFLGKWYFKIFDVMVHKLPHKPKASQKKDLFL